MFLMDLHDWLFHFQGLGHYRDALKDLDTLLKLDPNNVQAERERDLLLTQLQVGRRGHNNVLHCVQSPGGGHTTVDL